MVQVPLNELFKLALDALAELAGNASSLGMILRGDLSCGVELVPHVRQLMDIVEQKSEDCIQQLDSIATNVESATSDLEKASDAAEQALQAVAKAAPDVSTRADALSTHTTEVVTEVAHEKAKATSTVDEGMSNAREDAARAIQAAEALAAVLSTRIEETRKAMEELSQAIHDSRTLIGTATQKFLDAQAEVSRNMQAGAHLYRGGIDALMNAEATHLTSLANHKVEAHNLLMGPLRLRFQEEEPAALHAMVDAVAEHMAAIIAECDQRDDAVRLAAEKCEPHADKGETDLEKFLDLVHFVVTL